MIIRRKHSSNYTVVPNAIFQDSRLSVTAKGLLGCLLSLPPDWDLKHEDLQRRFSIGRQLLSRALTELIRARYVKRDDEQGRDEQNRFTTYNYVVSDSCDPARHDAENGPKEPLCASPQRPRPLRGQRQRIISKEE